jgi:predicted flap endonuclease-1-like 5' DNA nuclease
MKKIGILFGQEDTFPWAFIDRVNSKNIDGIVAEQVTIDKVIQGELTQYAVIIDRISQDVPFYRAYLKNAAICGTAVINNPFWWSADEKFFNNSLALKVGVPVPKTVLLPSKERPDDTTDKSFRNLKYPLSWEEIFDYIGFPAYMKPHDGGGWKSVFKVHNPEELFAAYAETGQLVMMLQENIDFTDYYRCYGIGGKYVHLMPYEPRNPHHLRYKADREIDPALEATLKDYVLKLCNALGYDFNTVELAVRDGIPYAIDFCNPAPDADIHSVGEENFEWIVETMATYAIERAQAQEDGKDNLTWGSFITDAVTSKFQTPATDGVSDAYIEEKVNAAVDAKIEEITDIIIDGIVDATMEEIGEEIAESLAERAVAMVSEEMIAELAKDMEADMEEEEEEEEEDEDFEEEEVDFEEDEIEVTVFEDDLEDRVESIIEEKIDSIIERILGKISEETIEAIAAEITKELSDTETLEDIAEDAMEEYKEEVAEALEEAIEEKGEATASKNDELDATAATKFVILAAIGKATAADKDDLKKIKGIGPKLQELLNSIEIYTFAQVSKMTATEYDLVDNLFPTFKGRGERDNWAGQAKAFLN